MAATPVVPGTPNLTSEPAPLSEGARIVNTFIAPLKNIHRPAPKRQLVATLAVDLHLSPSLFIYVMGRTNQLRADQQK